MKKTADTIDTASKIVRPIWALVVGLLGLGIWFGQFYSQYMDNAQNGSPALRLIIGKINERIDQQDKKLELFQQQVDIEKREYERRLNLIENHK